MRLWFEPRPGPALSLLGLALRPLSWLAASIATRRRAAARALLAPIDPGRPIVIVVGNVLVGGTGKTPAVLALARHLGRHGARVGLLAGGYRARTPGPHRVTPDSDPDEVGDEAVHLARASGLPVVSGRDRRAALALLMNGADAPAIVISDDGLQHHALARDVELVVFDRRGVGNGLMLPAGPLREPLEAARGADALLLNGTDRAPLAHPRRLRYEVLPTGFHRVCPGPVPGSGGDSDGSRSAPAPAFPTGDAPLDPAAFKALAAGRRVLAVAGLADPSRFFRTLGSLGIVFEPLALPDHAQMPAAALRALPHDLIVMTAKDAVKWPPGEPDRRCWVLAVEACFDDPGLAWLDQHLAALQAQRGSRPAGAPGTGA